LVFLLVWILALATTMSRFLYPDGRRFGEAKSPERRFLGTNLAKGHLVIFA